MSTTWEGVLDDLELRVTQAEALLHHAGEQEAPDEDALAEALGAGWEPPTGLGPIPAELAARAREIQARQNRVVDGFSTAAGERRKQAQLVETMKFGGAAMPVYLDQAG